MSVANLYKGSSCGRYGAFSLEITVGATQLPDLGTDAIQSAACAAAQLIKAAVMEAVIRNDPEAIKQAAEQRTKLIMLINAYAQLRKRYLHSPLWAFVADICGVGSTTATEICKECGWSPHAVGLKSLPWPGSK